MALGKWLTSSKLAYLGTVSTATSTTQFKASDLAGFKNSYFNGWSVCPVWDAAGAGGAPQNEASVISAYTGADGTFTHTAFTAQLALTDKVLILHPSVVDALAIKAKTDLILPGTKLVTKTSTSTLTTGNLFNLAGSVQILSIIGRVTTIIQSQATTCKLGIQADSLTIQDICATLDINGFAVGSMLGITGRYADAMQGTTGVPTKAPMTPINFTCVTSGIIKVTYGAASSGAIVWEVLWMPLNAAGSVVAA